jgi:hypothetical protein
LEHLENKGKTKKQKKILSHLPKKGEKLDPPSMPAS